MATWTDIPDEVLEPGKPIRSVDALALRDNAIAIAEGASGAPRILDAALGSNATNAGRNWVLARNALATAGAVGTYVFASPTSSSAYSLGSTVSGSNLRPSSSGGGSSGSLSGTWRCMGYMGSGDIVRASVFLRIS